MNEPRFTMLPHLKMTAFCVLSLAAPGCNDNDSNTTVVTTTNTPTTPTSQTDPTEAAESSTSAATGPTESTESSGETGAGESSTAGSTSDDIGSTTDGPQSCWPDVPPTCRDDGACDEGLDCVDTVCSCDALAATASDFCGVISAMAMGAGISDPYLGFVDDMCTSGVERCTVCFNLQNYCDQLAGQCTGLYAACGCVGEFYGVN